MLRFKRYGWRMPSTPAPHADTGAPAAQRAYAATKDHILSGRIAAGALISEGEIAAQLGVSRTPVREAFLRLEAEELLRLIPKRGAVVVPVPPTEAADILDVRLALETGAVRRLADRRTDITDALRELSALLEDQARLAAAGHVTEFATADEAFHRGIVGAAVNAIADRFYATLADRQRRMTIGAITAQPHRLAALVEEHRQLLFHVHDRDTEKFRAALQDHLANTHNVFHAR